ncbi:MAG TPA: 30S ribosomal protein S4 [Thermoplasmata archaeon]|nr:30S ribosomal protein S4 [Thermoplasmata archaeon]
MGDPKKPRKKMDKPSHPWEGERIAAENELKRKYALKNKKELWKAETELRRIRRRARLLFPKVGRGNPQVEKEKEELLNSLVRKGILSQGSDLSSVLSLDTEAILSRRLQTVVYLKGLARTPKQARQFITHGHIAIAGRRVTVPGYIVKREEEDLISFYPGSVLANEMHPLRKTEEDITEEELEELKKRRAQRRKGPVGKRRAQRNN